MPPKKSAVGTAQEWLKRAKARGSGITIITIFAFVAESILSLGGNSGAKFGVSDGLRHGHIG